MATGPQVVRAGVVILAVIACAAWGALAGGVYQPPIKLLPIGPESDVEAGRAVAIGGRFLALGAPRDDDERGAVHLYGRDPDHDPVWRPLGRIPAPEGFDGTFYGDAVAIEGDAIIVGAPWGPGMLSGVGAAFLYERDPVGGLWRRVAWLVPPDTGEAVNFGSAVAIEGDTAIIGAPLDELDGVEAGSVYVYRRSEPGPVWSFVQKLRASDVGRGYNFGIAVDLEADLLAIGDSIREAVYVFERSDEASDFHEIDLVEAPEGAPSHFGGALAMSGETILAGADGGRFSNAVGAGYVLDRGPEGRWSVGAELVGATAEPSDNLGFSVALEGGLAVVGMDVCPGLTDCGDPGSAYVFARNEQDPGLWTEIAELTTTDPRGAVKLGFDVATDRGIVVAGAPFDDELGTHRGAAFVFEPADCVLELRLDRTEVVAGESVTASVHLEHRHVLTVTVPLIVWIEDGAGRVLTWRRTPPITFRHGDVLDRSVPITVPPGAPPGPYRLQVGVERMHQGVAWAEQELRVVAERPAAE